MTATDIRDRAAFWAMSLGDILPLTPEQARWLTRVSPTMQYTFDGEFEISVYVKSYGGAYSAYGASATYYHEVFVSHALKGAASIQCWLMEDGTRHFTSESFGRRGTDPQQWGRSRDPGEVIELAKAYLMGTFPHGELAAFYAERIARPLHRLSRADWRVRARLCREARAARLGQL